jgi:MFS family permease
MMADSSLILAIAGTIAVGAALGGINLLYTVIAGDGTSSDQRGRTIGSVNVFGDLGSALGPFLAVGASPLISPSSVYRICAWLLLLLGVYAAIHSKREAYQKTPPGQSLFKL